MISKYWIGVILIGLSLNFLSCSKKDDPQPSQPSQPTPVTIFHDNFVDNRNGWYLRNDSAVFIAIHNDSLLFTNKNIYPAFCIWNYIGIDTTKKFSIKTLITKKSGVNNYAYGMIWGASDANNCFNFEISQNGYYIIYKTINGVIYNIKNWTVSSTIYYTSPNKLEIIKDGGNLIFFINDTQVYSMPFQSFLGTGLGFEVNNNIALAIDYVDVTQWR